MVEDLKSYIYHQMYPVVNRARTSYRGITPTTPPMKSPVAQHQASASIKQLSKEHTTQIHLPGQLYQGLYSQADQAPQSR